MAEYSLEELKRIDSEAEEMFEQLYKEQLRKLESEYPRMLPSKRSEMARKYAYRQVSRILSERYGISWGELKAKIRAAEESFSLEEIAGGW